MAPEPTSTVAQTGPRLVTLSWAFVSAASAGVLLLVLLQRLGLAPAWLNAGYFALGLAGAAAIAGLARGPQPGAMQASALFRGLALATDSISAAFFLGAAGAVFVWGHDGLAFVLGLGAGYLLLQLLIAPLLPRTGAGSLPEFFALRYPGKAPRLLAALAVVVSMAALLVAQLMAAGLVTARLLELPFDIAVALAGAALLAAFVIRGRAASPWVRGVLFAVMLLSFLAPAVALSAAWYGLPVPQLAYANALWQIQGLEETLLEQDLADPVVMTPMLTPLLSLNPLDVLGLVLGLALGSACLPHVLRRYFLIPPVRAARWSAVWALVFAALFLSAVPALAAYAKLSLLSLIADRTDLATLPAWIFAYGKLGLVEICGRAATDAAAIMRACAGVPDAGGILRLQDLTLHPDMITLAAPEMAGLDAAMFGLLAAAGLAAALVTADGPLAAIVRALTSDLRASSEPRPDGKGGARWLACAIAAAVLLGAGFAAAARPASMLTVTVWACALAAAGLFPALVAGLWWRRANAYGAVAAMVAGLAVCLFYLVGTRYFAVSFFETWASLSSAGPTAREIFAELKDTWMTAAPGAAKQAAWYALDVHAQGIANWWGIKPLAVAILALPAGIVGVVAASLLTPAPQSDKA